ncbi:MAG: hypothetical protein RLZZ423_193 [Cyanobacteriota bacterium]|jgi:hypothetical protein
MEPPASPRPIADTDGPVPAETRLLQVEARLVHAEPGQRVVEVSAWQQGQCLGRSLGEASSAEAAEDRALARLNHRLTQTSAPAAPSSGTAMATAGEPVVSPRTRPAPPQRRATAAAAPDAIAEPATPQLPLLSLGNGTPEPAGEPNPDPEDWSEELAELDVQLQRLGWDRNQESTYLQRSFGHPSRNRLTAYADVVAYLRALRGLTSGTSPENAMVPLRRRDLLEQCELLLSQLGWDPARGRQLLENSFQLSSRQQLSDEQLLQFNMLLESELIGCGSAPAATATPG